MICLKLGLHVLENSLFLRQIIGESSLQNCSFFLQEINDVQLEETTEEEKVQLDYIDQMYQQQ